MLVFVIEPDQRRARAVGDALDGASCSAMFAHDFASAERLLTSAEPPDAVYVADVVPPLAGADLLSLLERNAVMAGVPLVAGVLDEGSLMAAALARGGVRIVRGDLAPRLLASTLASLASTASADPSRRGVTAWPARLHARRPRHRPANDREPGGGEPRRGRPLGREARLASGRQRRGTR